MPVDSKLKEICELLLAATRSGLLKWTSPYLEQIITAKLDGNTFTINADAPNETISSWLISLTVNKNGNRVFAATLDGSVPEQREGAELLSEVWKNASVGINRDAAQKLDPVIQSLRSAISGANHVVHS